MMAIVTVKGVLGQLDRRVDENGRIYLGEWRNQEVIVLLKPKDYTGYSNEKIKAEVDDVIRKFKKDALLIAVERELGLDRELVGYNPDDGTISKETLARIYLGIRRLKGSPEERK
jgi:hypothetical protein